MSTTSTISPGEPALPVVVALELCEFDAPPEELVDAPAVPVVSAALAVAPPAFEPPAPLDGLPLDAPPLPEAALALVVSAVPPAPTLDVVVAALAVIDVELNVVPTA